MEVVLSIVVGWKYLKWRLRLFGSGSAIFGTFSIFRLRPAAAGMIIVQLK